MRLAIRFHLLLCRHCRNYVMQLGAIDAEARRRWSAGSEDPSHGSLERRIVQQALKNASSSPAAKGKESDESLAE